MDVVKQRKQKTMSNEDNKKGFFKGVIVGGIIGGVTALLYAPKSGKETREDIKNKLDEAYTELNHKVQEAKRSGGDQTKELLKKAEDIKRQLERQSNEIAKSGKKVGKVTAEQAKALAKQAADLAAELAISTKKVVKQGQKEVNRLQAKSAKERAKKSYTDNKKPADKK